jgi:hypothetical protein
MMTSVLTAPALVFDQATAITRKVPLKAGRSKMIRARPSGPTLTTPEKRASGSCVGTVKLSVTCGAPGNDVVFQIASGPGGSIEQHLLGDRGHACECECVIFAIGERDSHLNGGVPRGQQIAGLTGKAAPALAEMARVSQPGRT